MKDHQKQKTEISWTMVEMLVDLDFADDIALLLHRHWAMQEEKTNRLANTAERLA